MKYKFYVIINEYTELIIYYLLYILIYNNYIFYKEIKIFILLIN